MLWDIDLIKKDYPDVVEEIERNERDRVLNRIKNAVNSMSDDKKPDSRYDKLIKKLRCEFIDSLQAEINNWDSLQKTQYLSQIERTESKVRRDCLNRVIEKLKAIIIEVEKT